MSYPVKDRQSFIEVEEALQTNEVKFRAFIEHMPQRIFMKDLNSVYVTCNQSYSRDLGIEIDAIAGKTDFDFHPRQLAEKYRADDQQVMTSGASMTFEEKYFRDGKEKWIRTTKTPYLDEKGKIAGIIGSFEEITGHKQAQETFIRGEEYFRTLIENSTDIIMIVDAKGTIIFASPSVERFIGYTPDEMIGMNAFDFIMPADIQRAFADFAQALLVREESTFNTFRVRHKDGSERILEGLGKNLLDNKTITGFIMNIHDVTDRKKIEKQLRQAQRMEAIGTLASGIAHDFNNILTPILLGTEMAQLSIPEESPVQHDLKKVIEATNRAKELVKQIMTFSHRGEEEKGPLNLITIVKEALKLIRASLPSTIEIKQHIEANSAMVKASAAGIHQVIMNLCTNAAYAMRQKGGLLEIRLTNENIKSSGPIQSKDLKPGNYIKLSVLDTGQGMDSLTIEKIFDPFFTTKEQGEGTGMGLSVVHGIIKSLGGKITVHSELQKGTTFTVYLPCMHKAADQNSETHRNALPGSERILFIDDEIVITDLYKNMLERLGYKVDTTYNAIEALDLFRKDPKRFDLIITDQTMPKMTGIALAKELICLRPDLPIILCTGLSQEKAAEEARRMGVKEVLFKPVGRVALVQAIRKLLDRV
ncbi:MAG: PAS domain S-box protein [Smithellaceae bacterium]